MTCFEKKKVGFSCHLPDGVLGRQVDGRMAKYRKVPVTVPSSLLPGKPPPTGWELIWRQKFIPCELAPLEYVTQPRGPQCALRRVSPSSAVLTGWLWGT